MDGRVLDDVVVVAVVEGGNSLAGATPDTEVAPVVPVAVPVMLLPLRALSELEDRCRLAEVRVGVWW
jgi:hypothetical protein